MKHLKKTILLSLLLISGILFQAKAQDNIIKTNIIGVFAGQYQLAYERAISPKFSVQLSAGYLAGKSEGSSSINGDSYGYDNKRSGFIFIPELRWYPLSKAGAPRGLFIGGFGRLRQANNNLTDTGSGTEGIAQNLSRKRDVTTIGGGGVIGFQWVSEGGFSFDIFAGTSYKSRKTDTVYNTQSLNNASTDPNFDSLGDELFNQKYLDFKLDDKDGFALRFGFHFGYAF
jgi:hypothetical protein